ncbi:MAG: sensor histidine kinase KdpD, partial [Rhodospirillales bacterium]|nr:sensor histidine kinase KdpD [Rhodospirillales bacterium]
NLTALRELALRRTAQRVDEQLLSHMRSHAIRGPWAAGERVVVCVSESERCAALVRQAKRMADHLHAPWTAVYVETARTQRLTDVERDRIADCQRLAERLGGEAFTIPGADIAEEVLRFARDNNVTQIVIGKSNRSRWFEVLHGSVVHDLVRKAGSIGVHVSSADQHDGGEAIAPKTIRTKQPSKGLDLAAYAVTCVAVAGALALGLVLRPVLGVENVDLIFLIAVLLIASRYGLWPSMAASVASGLAYNFFFFDPVYTFTINDPAHVVAVLFFMVSALIASNLAGRVRDQAKAARQRARTSEALYAFSRKLAGVAAMDDLMWAAAFQIASMLRLNVVMLVPESTGQLAVRVGYPPEDRVDDADLAAAHWSWKHNRPAGRGAETLPGGKRLFMPIRTNRGAVGVIGLDRERPGPLFTPDERRLLDALLDQTAVAIERVQLAKEIDEARVLTETERLRSALLASISHDLSTPLASILGAATSLQNYDALYDSGARQELVATILDESERLHRFVRNLLDMTRLESGAIEPNREMIDVGEAIGAALERCGRMLILHRVELDIEPDLPMLELDAVLLEQVLINLLDNASKYAPPGSAVSVLAKRQAGSIVLQVCDEGPGMPEGEMERVFTKFHRLHEGDRKRPGTGLGLAVCRGFVEALGGTIVAGNRSDRSGAVFTLTFPERPAEERPVADAAA